MYGRRMRPTAPAVRCSAAGLETRAPPEEATVATNEEVRRVHERRAV